MKDSKKYPRVDPPRPMHRDPITGRRGAHPLGTAAGATGGAITGALLGSLGGTVGSAMMGTVGAITGGVAGKMMGEERNPTGPDAYWRTAYRSEPYFNKLFAYEDYAPAYRSAHAHRLANFEGAWEQAEAELRASWESTKQTSRLQWEDAKHAARAAWHHAKRPTPPPREKRSALA